jgi:hypothetical protein
MVHVFTGPKAHPGPAGSADPTTTTHYRESGHPLSPQSYPNLTFQDRQAWKPLSQVLAVPEPSDRVGVRPVEMGDSRETPDLPIFCQSPKA